MKKRQEILEEFKWDLSDYFSNDNEWKELFLKTKEEYKKVCEFENNLTTKENIYNCLESENKISQNLGLLYVYASLKVKEDSTNSFYLNLLNKIDKLSVQVEQDFSFITSEIKELSDDFLIELSNDIQLKNYDLYFKDIVKNKKHMLSKCEEKLLAGTGEFSGDFSDIFDKFDTADIKFDNIVDCNGKTYEMNNSVYAKYSVSRDRVLRKNAYKSMNGAYGKLNNTLTAIYMGNVKSDCFYSKIRNFPSSLAASLYGEEVDESVYKTLIKSVNDNLKTFHKYFDLKKDVLGVDKLAIYDVRVGTDENEKEYAYDEAYDIVINSTKVLGEDYIDVLKQAKQQRWLDIYANEGKDTGAFSWGFYGKHPVVLLNYEDTISDVFTLGHELGHSMHTYYSNNAQPVQKAGYEIFVAEVASTVNEMLILTYLLNQAKTDKEKACYYDHLFKMFYSTIFRQTLFSEFEEYVHKAYENGEETTPKAINEYYYNLNRKYFGEKVEFVDELKYEWSRIPHFYSSFYVYKYATGLISAFYIANQITSGNKEVLKGYREFLTLGSTKPPVELLKVAGVDLNDKNAFDYVFDQMDKLLDEWSKLI